jgi:hypothetical protein
MKKSPGATINNCSFLMPFEKGFFLFSTRLQITSIIDFFVFDEHFIVKYNGSNIFRVFGKTGEEVVRIKAA